MDNQYETVSLGFTIEKESVVAKTRLSPQGHYNRGFYRAVDDLAAHIQTVDKQDEALRKELYKFAMEMRPRLIT